MCWYRRLWSVAVADAYPWQQALWQQLAGRSQHAHAYLLHGPQGIGKRAMAERLMQVLPIAQGRQPPGQLCA